MKMTLPIQNRLIAMLIICFVFTSISQAQMWNRTYIDDRPLMYFSSVLHENGIYHIAGGTRDTNGLNYTRAMLGKINNAGDLSSYKVVYDSAMKNYGAFYNALIINSHYELCYTGYSRDSMPKLLFLKQNLSNDSIGTYEYSIPNSYALQGYKVIEVDSSYYITGVHTDDDVNSANIILVKLDSSGNKLWHKYFGVSNRMEYAKSIIKLTNGNLLLGGVRIETSMSNEHSNTWLLEVDQDGNFVKQWFDPNDSTYAAEGILQTLDGGFIYGGQKKYLQIGTTIGYTGCITKMNSIFGKQWVYNGGYRSIYTCITDVIELVDGSIIGCGQKFSFENDTNVLYGWVIKLTPQGNVVWEHVYSGINASPVRNYLADIDVLPDGSLIAVGQCQHPGHSPPQVGWFLKLDSNGCEIENCLVGISTESAVGFNSLTVFYNQDFKSITFEAADMQGGEIKIYDLAGKIVYQGRVEHYKESISTIAYAHAVYVLHLQKENLMKHAKFVVY